MSANTPSIQELRRLFAYDGTTGALTRRVSTARNVKAGDAVGTLMHGYLYARVEGRMQAVHRIVWAMVSGEWPQAMVDHIDGDRANNRFSNLRLADASLNGQNQRRAHRQNKTGLLGVGVVSGAFTAQIKHDGRKVHLGRFASAEDAHAAYLEAKRRLHSGCTL